MEKTFDNRNLVKLTESTEDVADRTFQDNIDKLIGGNGGKKSGGMFGQEDNTTIKSVTEGS